jgi:hypothetical protein
MLLKGGREAAAAAKVGFFKHFSRCQQTAFPLDMLNGKCMKIPTLRGPPSPLKVTLKLIWQRAGSNELSCLKNPPLFS